MFSKKTTENTKTGDFHAIKTEVEQILELDLSSDGGREEHGKFVMDALHRLDLEIENISKQANGYPENPISALVWLNGTGFGNLACALTGHFQKAGWIEQEEYASALWAKVTLAVCSHYHHMVGPAMLANADCNDRLGNMDRATQWYIGLVRDFTFLTDNWENETDSLDNESRTALKSLLSAVERLIERGIQEIDGIGLSSLQTKTKTILSRPMVSQQQESS